ncbi:HIRAN domain-containing protein [Aeromonas caviae]|uniref:HIRAN domain-containing protein n=1 Tax=Aeromonas caviae TaxID=648 RepID=UPI002B4A8552|nr:HIRAN domain-containing protein [Aeromonas caviae]
MMNRNNSVYVAWQDPESRFWHVVGCLRELENGYLFNYTKGALASEKFTKFSGMDDFNTKYISEDLFPLFKNRLLSSRRPEYKKFISWLGLNSENASEINPIEILARSGGLRATDQLQMYKPIEIDSEGNIEHYFFSHGLSHLTASSDARVSALKEGEKLYLCPDPQNKYDSSAVIIRADKPAEIVGFCPRFFSGTISKLLHDEPLNLSLAVERISHDAPYQYRLLCKLSGRVSQRNANFHDINDESILI